MIIASDITRQFPFEEPIPKWGGQTFKSKELTEAPDLHPKFTIDIRQNDTHESSELKIQLRAKRKNRAWCYETIFLGVVNNPTHLKLLFEWLGIR